MFKRIPQILTLALLMVTASASAETLSSPASNCRGPASALVFWDGEFVNPSTTSVMDANCPVISSSAAPVVQSAKVVLRDRNYGSGQRVACRVTSQWIAADGQITWYESALMASPNGDSTLTTPVGFGAVGENLNFQCQVPAKTANGVSSIFRYEVTR